MVPRIVVELTSKREDGDWTWRALGARKPKGVISGKLLPQDASIGRELRVETEHFLDGVVVTKVLEEKGSNKKSELLEILGSGIAEPPVTTKLASRKGRKNDNKSRDNKGKNRDNKSFSKKKTEDKSNSKKPFTSRKPDNKKNLDKRPKKNSDDFKPAKSNRLKAKRHHRNAALKELPEEYRRVGHLLIRGGVPGLREAVEKQNTKAAEAGEPPIPSELLLKFAEQIYPKLRTAEWHDRAEAALNGMEKIDLKDIRSVIVASENSAKTPETKLLAEKIVDGFNKRVESDQIVWVNEMIKSLKEDRIVRALRLSSRPPKAGSPLPKELLDNLTTSTNAALTAEVTQARWATIVDAVAFSPVHLRVVP